MGPVSTRYIPPMVRDYVLQEGCNSCPLCGTGTLDLHHILFLSAGGPNIASNLIGICPTHHRQHHLDYISVNLLIALKRAQQQEFSSRHDAHGLTGEWHRRLQRRREAIVRSWIIAQNQPFIQDPYRTTSGERPFALNALVLATSGNEFITPPEEVEMLLAMGHYLNRHRLLGMPGSSGSIDAQWFAMRARMRAEKEHLEVLEIKAGLADAMFQYCRENFKGAGVLARDVVRATPDVRQLGVQAFDLSMYLALGGFTRLAMELWTEAEAAVVRGSIFGDRAWIYHTGFLIGCAATDRSVAEYSLDKFIDDADQAHPLFKIATQRDDAIRMASKGNRLAAIDHLEAVEAESRRLGFEHQEWVAKRMNELLQTLPRRALDIGWLHYYLALQGRESNN